MVDESSGKGLQCTISEKKPVVLVFQMQNKLLIGNSNVLCCHNNVLYVL